MLCQVAVGVRLDLVGEPLLHGVNAQGAVAQGCDPVAEQMDAREVAGVLSRPSVVATPDEIGRVHLGGQFVDERRQLGAVRVADSVGAEPLDERPDLFVHPCLDGQSQSAAAR